MKPTRKVCKAMWSGVRDFEVAGLKIVTGCTASPLPGKTYCVEHDGEQTPVSDKVGVKTRKLLQNCKDKTVEMNVDDVFIIESIYDVIEDAKGSKMYKVKWFGYPEEACTLEPPENIPEFIKDYYTDKEKFMKKLPNPKIRTSKKLSDGTTYHYLTWEGESGGHWLPENFFKLADGDEEEDFNMINLPKLTCGTRKSRDKRICR